MPTHRVRQRTSIKFALSFSSGVISVGGFRGLPGVRRGIGVSSMSRFGSRLLALYKLHAKFVEKIKNEKI